MSNKTLFYLTIAVLVGIAALFAINLATFLTPQQPQAFLKYDFVRGIAAKHNDKFFTLNFDQQNEFIEMLNRSIKTREIVGQVLKRPVIEKILVYQFNSPDIEIIPIAQSDENLLFKVIGTDGYLLDVSSGSMINLLSQIYDK